jgi:hypothetical protein
MGRIYRLFTGVALLAATAAPAHAASLGTGPLRVADLQSYRCAVVNIGTRPTDVEVVVTIGGGGGGADKSCAALAPNGVCVAENDAGFAADRFCTVAAGSRRSVRSAFCNVSTGICVPVQ